MADSPCISVCRLDDGVCAGCHRTQEEVVEWWNMTDAQQQAVLDRIERELFD